MGQANTVTTQIEIAGSPAAVRAVFLNWQRYNEWNPRWALTPLNTDKQPTELQPGDQMKVDMNGTIFRPVVIENSEKAFRWHGSLYGLFEGTHQFHFTPSEKTAGSTTLIQQEDFSGLLAFPMAPGWSAAKQTQANFKKFNEALKTEAEKTTS